MAGTGAEFIELEEVDAVRMVWNVWPYSRLEAAKCVIPFGVMHSPAKQTANLQVCRIVLHFFSSRPVCFSPPSLTVVFFFSIPYYTHTNTHHTHTTNRLSSTTLSLAKHAAAFSTPTAMLTSTASCGPAPFATPATTSPPTTKASPKPPSLPNSSPNAVQSSTSSPAQVPSPLPPTSLWWTPAWRKMNWLPAKRPWPRPSP